MVQDPELKPMMIKVTENLEYAEKFHLSNIDAILAVDNSYLQQLGQELQVFVKDVEYGTGVAEDERFHAVLDIMIKGFQINGPAGWDQFRRFMLTLDNKQRIELINTTLEAILNSRTAILSRIMKDAQTIYPLLEPAKEKQAENSLESFLAYFSDWPIKNIFEVMNPESDLFKTPDENISRFYGLKFFTAINENVTQRDIAIAKKIIEKNPEFREQVLGLVAEWTHRGSSEAQNFLNARIYQLQQRSVKVKQPIVLTEEDKMYLDAIAQSFSQQPLLSLFLNEGISIQDRMEIAQILAFSGYIDSGYAQINDDELGVEERAEEAVKYFKVINDVYKVYALVPPFIFVQQILDGKIDLEYIKDVRPGLDEFVNKNDYHQLVQALAQNRKLSLAYYFFYQSPFTYPGTDTLSFERFERMVEHVASRLEHENTRIVFKDVAAGYMKAGLNPERANEIAQALLQGRPPLPKDSPYLDKDGRFIPQQIDVLKMFVNNNESKEQAEAFAQTLGDVAKVLKVNELMKRVASGINLRFKNPNMADDYRAKLNAIINSISLDVDINDLWQKLYVLHNEIFPSEGRRREVNIEDEIVRKINAAIEGISVLKKMLNGNIHSNGVVLIEILKMEDFIRALSGSENGLKNEVGQFLGDLFARLDLDLGLTRKLDDLVGNLSLMVDNQEQILSRHIDVKNIPPVIYLDFITKSNLIEFLRFADGGHCCLTSDPKISRQFGNIYEKHMPNYMANATTFLWQYSLGPRKEKQIGWYQNWIGLDEEGKVLVGTEKTYFSPSYRSTVLQEAILKKVEEILFSTKVTKIVQPDFGNKPANALEPPGRYEKEELTITKLQSLIGFEIHEDAPMTTNDVVTGEFRVVTNGVDNSMRAFSKWNWRMASDVPWEECVHFSTQGLPKNDNENNLWKNLKDVRVKFLETLQEMIADPSKEEKWFLGQLEEMNRILILGLDGKSFYRSNTGISDDSLREIAGKPFGGDEVSFKRISTVFSGLKKILLNRSEYSTIDFVERLSLLYRDMIDFDTFVLGNNSLFMNMVNGLLRLNGLQGISHKGLDLLARGEYEPISDERFKGIFVEQVKERNPGKVDSAQLATIKIRALENLAQDIADDLLHDESLNSWVKFLDNFIERLEYRINNPSKQNDFTGDPFLKDGILDPEAVKYFANQLNNLWKFNGFNLRYGSLFDVIPIVCVSLRDSNLSRVRYFARWAVLFLEAGSLKEEAFGLWQMVIANIGHLRFLGVHPEEELMLDQELMIGKNEFEEGIVQRYIKVLLKLSKDQVLFNQVLEGNNPRNIRVRDILLYGLVLAIDPSIHRPVSYVPIDQSDIDKAFLKRWGRKVDSHQAMLLAIQQILNYSELISRKSEVEELLIEAASITDNQWKEKGFQVPEAFEPNIGPSLNLFKEAGFSDNTSWRFYPLDNRFLLWIFDGNLLPNYTFDNGIKLQPAQDAFSRSNQKLVDERKVFYRTVYGSNEVFQLFPRLANMMRERDPAQAVKTPLDIDSNAKFQQLFLDQVNSIARTEKDPYSIWKSVKGIKFDALEYEPYGSFRVIGDILNENGEMIEGFNIEVNLVNKSITNFSIVRYSFRGEEGKRLFALLLIWLNDFLKDDQNRLGNENLSSFNTNVFVDERRMVDGSRFFKEFTERFINDSVDIKDAFETLTRVYINLKLLNWDKMRRFIKGGNSDIFGNKGGIDLSSDKAMQVKSNGSDAFGFKLDPAMFKQYQDAPGFIPVIINIESIGNVRKFLGLPVTAP